MVHQKTLVIPVKTGIHLTWNMVACSPQPRGLPAWIPVFTGVTQGFWEHLRCLFTIFVSVRKRPVLVSYKAQK
jgi:hypothetical protein